MTIDALVWVPRMLYLFGEQKMGLPEQWFTTTVLLRDIAVITLCVLVIRQIYRPELDIVRHGGLVDDPSGGCLRARCRRTAEVAAGSPAAGRAWNRFRSPRRS